jgi:hypothetical protein
MMWGGLLVGGFGVEEYEKEVVFLGVLFFIVGGGGG